MDHGTPGPLFSDSETRNVMQQTLVGGQIDGQSPKPCFFALEKALPSTLNLIDFCCVKSGFSYLK